MKKQIVFKGKEYAPQAETTDLSYVYTVTEHNVESKSDCLRGVFKTEESAYSFADKIKENYVKMVGVDDFTEYYLLRIEKMEVKE